MFSWWRERESGSPRLAPTRRADEHTCTRSLLVLWLELRLDASASLSLRDIFFFCLSLRLLSNVINWKNHDMSYTIRCFGQKNTECFTNGGFTAFGIRWTAVADCVRYCLICSKTKFHNPIFLAVVRHASLSAKKTATWTFWQIFGLIRHTYSFLLESKPCMILFRKSLFTDLLNQATYTLITSTFTEPTNWLNG